MRPEIDKPQAVPPIFSAYGAAMALHVIANRGALMPGDINILHVASSLLFNASKEGKL